MGEARRRGLRDKAHSADAEVQDVRLTKGSWEQSTVIGMSHTEFQSEFVRLGKQMSAPNREKLSSISVDEADRFERVAMYTPKARTNIKNGHAMRTCPSCGMVLVDGLGAGPDYSETRFRCVCGQWSIHPRGSAFAAADSMNVMYVPNVLYRYFDDESYFEDLLAGKVWVSTIEACRQNR